MARVGIGILPVNSMSKRVQSVKTGRKLTLKARAQRQAQTRLRIVEAAVALHTTIGPARTTVSAIAERAGVQRQTVYAHFPDERSLFESCTAHGRAAFPPPDLGSWQQIEDPRQRLLTGLAELYSYFRQTAPGWAAILRDAEVVPLVREFAEKGRLAYLAAARKTLATGWPVRGERKTRLQAMVALAVDFRTWETIAAKQGLDDAQAASLMTDLISCTTQRST
jgi:AcrR family transcriptional regulator